MAKQRGRQPLFEYGGYWIDHEPGRDGFYRYWRDGRRVSRRKLAAGDLERAKAELVALVEQKPAAARDPQTVMMATVLAHYQANVIEPKRREPEKKTTVEKNFLLTKTRLMAFLAGRSPHKKAARVAEFDLPAQRAFWRLLNTEHDCGAKAISTYMSYLAAAVNDAAKPRVVDRDGREEEVSILTAPIRIEAGEKAIADALKLPLSAPKDWIPSMKEMAAFIDACREEHVFRYIVIALNTWARPEAITDLNFDEQVDLEHGLVSLLPEGRAPNKKGRPVIPLTQNLRAWHLHWQDPNPIRWKGEPVQSVKKAIQRLAGGLTMPEMSRYTLRHFMATQVRRQKLSRGRYVSRDQRSIWLGHVVREGSDTTSWYETYDPDYLAEAREATDQIIKELDRLMKTRRLVPRELNARSRLLIVKGGELANRLLEFSGTRVAPIFQNARPAQLSAGA